jgi:hypothetical protein
MAEIVIRQKTSSSSLVAYRFSPNYLRAFVCPPGLGWHYTAGSAGSKSATQPSLKSPERCLHMA